MNRRSFITGMAGILAAGTAPWVVTKAGVLMPVREIYRPPVFEWLDGPGYVSEETIYVGGYTDINQTALKCFSTIKEAMDYMKGKPHLIYTGIPPA